MFRLLLITLLIGLACAAYQQNHPARRPHHHRHHHRKPHHMVALDQLIKKKPAQYFLGRQFMHRAILNQPGDNKFLKLNGKEERDVNGTISFTKNNVLIDVNESKDGHFVVEDQKKRVVGRVDMHSGTNKHLNVHKLKNGNQIINGYQYGQGEVNVEKDMMNRYPGRFGNKKAPTKHIRMHVQQNHDANAHIEITDIKPRHQMQQQNQQQQIRYRRQAEMPIENPCLGKANCTQQSSQAKQFGKKVGEFFHNVTEKVKEAGRKMKAKICQFAYDNNNQPQQQQQQPQVGPGGVTQASVEATTWGKVADNNQPGAPKNSVGKFFQDLGQKIKGVAQAAAKKLVNNCTNINTGPMPGQPMPVTQLPTNNVQGTSATMVVVDGKTKNASK